MISRQENALDDIVRDHGKWQGDKTAAICDGEHITWREFDRRINCVASALLTSGIQKGDSVSTVMANNIENLAITFGILRAGAVMVPLSTLQPRQVLDRLVRNADSKMLFVSEAFAGLGAELAGDLLAGRVIAVGFSGNAMIDFDVFLASGSGEDPRFPIGPEDPCTIIYSSGTTGVPKGIVQSHAARNYFASMLALDLRFDSTAISLLTTPLYSNGTFMMMLPTFLVGGTIVIMRSFDVRQAFELVQRHRCTHTFMVPTQISAVLEATGPEEFDLSSLRVLVSAAAPLLGHTRERIQERIGPRLFELYGMTEGFGSLMKPEDMESRPGSVGKPFPGNDIRIIDDSGKELPWGNTGEVVGYSPALMTTYHKNPEQTSESIWRAEDGRIYIRSGDVAKLDEDGFLYILDRKKDMIISGGCNVFPRDIEEILETHPDIADAAVIGLPDPKWGERIVALVVPREGMALHEDELLTWANPQLAKYQRISAIEFRGELPRNQLGKLLKRQLREAYDTGERTPE